MGNALTLPDYFTNRFEDGSSLLRIVTALVILVFFTVYCASGVVAGARLFESMFGMDYQTALWVGAVATMAYVFIGGFLAVSWTDTIQASLMITALVMAPLMVIYADGGVGASAAIIETALLLSCLHQSALPPLPAAAAYAQTDAPLAAHGLTLGSGLYLMNFFGFGGSNTSIILEQHA